MATTYKGRTGSGSKSNFGTYSGYTYGTGLGGWGHTGGNFKKSNNNRKNNKRTGHSGTGSSAYKSCCTTFEKKISSYKTLCDQTRGPAGAGRPTPTTLNSFANWINKGAIVQTVSKAQVSRWARTTNKNFNTHNPSPSACKTVLAAKFGRSAIKCVARTKSGPGDTIVITTSSGWIMPPGCKRASSAAADANCPCEQRP